MERISRDDIKTPKDLQKVNQDIAAEKERLDTWEEQVIEQSTARQLEMIRAGRKNLLDIRAERDRAKARLLGEIKLPPRHAELTELIKRNMGYERALAAEARQQGQSLPPKYIREDAVKHFGDEAEQAKEKLASLEIPKTQPNVSHGGRVTDEMKRLQTIIDEWEKFKHLAVAGEKIHALRQEREAYTAERDGLEKARRDELELAS